MRQTIPRAAKKLISSISTELPQAAVALYKLEDVNAAASSVQTEPSSPLTDLEDLSTPEPKLRKSNRTRGKTAGIELKVETEAEAEGLARNPRKRKAVTDTSSPPQSKKEKTSSKPTRKTVSAKRVAPHPAPENWREVYFAIRDMRSKFVAPVDTMGCHYAQRHETDPKNKRYITLVSLMLSSQTKDEVVDAAIIKLRAAVGGTMSLDALLAADDATISASIQSCGFWRKKTQYLRRTAEVLRDKFDSDVPRTIEELCTLPGVGKKMGYLCLHAAWKINSGIGVDVHVDRITNRLGWHSPSTLGHPEQTRLNLESWLPRELHEDINPMLVGFGQVVCKPQRPTCELCTLSTRGLCPSAAVAVKKTSRKTAKASTSSGAKVNIELEEISTTNISPA